MTINIIIVGCGGTGSALFQDLARSEAATDEDTRIILIDGDVVERKNIGRQYFSISQVGMNKAEALANTASKVLNLKNIYYYDKYLENQDMLFEVCEMFPSKMTIIVGCVDNHPARKIIEEFVRSYDMSNYHSRIIYYIDCANELLDGEVITVFRERNRLIGNFRSDYDPSVLVDKTDEKRNGFYNIASCSEEIDKGEEQTLIANRKSAILALEFIMKALQKDYQIGICFFKESVIKRVTGVE